MHDGMFVHYFMTET